MKIPISKPYLGTQEQQAVVEVLASGWVVQGPRVAEFERRFAAYTGAPFAVATTSCTTALHLALVASGIGPGDEVIVPAFTWVATANVVESLGAEPVFVDIELETFNLEVSQIEAAIGPCTKALLPVSLFGHSAPMDAVMAIAARHHLKVVEDDACALGAWYGERHAGTLADIGCFSFHPRKAITTGEGGMLITGDEKTAVLARSLRDHGASTSDLARHLGARSYILPEFKVVGFNYRMTDLQGAVGVVQMERLGRILEHRTRLARRYDEALAGLGWLQPPRQEPGCRHGYQSYVCLFQPEQPGLDNLARLHARRNALMDDLEARGIATRPGTHAVHMLDYYHQKYRIKPEDCPNAYLADHLTITLPLYTQMTPAEQDYVIAALRQWSG